MRFTFSLASRRHRSPECYAEGGSGSQEGASEWVGEEGKHARYQARVLLYSTAFRMDIFHAPNPMSWNVAFLLASTPSCKLAFVLPNVSSAPEMESEVVGGDGDFGGGGGGGLTAFL